MEHESSLPHSQELSTCPYPKPAQSSPHHSSLLLQDTTCTYIGLSRSKLNSPATSKYRQPAAHYMQSYCRDVTQTSTLSALCNAWRDGTKLQPLSGASSHLVTACHLCNSNSASSLSLAPTHVAKRRKNRLPDTRRQLHTRRGKFLHGSILHLQSPTPLPGTSTSISHSIGRGLQPRVRALPGVHEHILQGM
jgi:hypothetical protein